MKQTKAQTQATNIAVVGLGVTGLSCVRWCLRQGLNVKAMDTRDEPPNIHEFKKSFPSVPVFLGPLRVDDFVNVQQVLLSPGLPVQNTVMQTLQGRGVEIIGDIELFARHVKAPVVAITGSNGKSTVTTLVGEMAKQVGWRTQVGGNLGTPALDLITEPEPDVYVVELSSFQLETTHSLQAKAATVLNISADHMDRYDSVQAYANAKRKIFDHAQTCVVNLDDPMVVAMVNGANVVGFTLGAPSQNQYGVLNQGGLAVLAKGKDVILPVSELKIAGAHNQANALAAIALGDAIGLPRAAMIHVLRTFPGLPHRTQLVADHKGVRWYDDSKGTNVGATIAAVKGMPGPVVLIAGGDGKGQDFSELAPALAGKVRAVVLIGRDAPAIDTAVKSVVTTVFAETMADAVERCATLAQRGDQVLLSPACASFDMFKNYHHRGEVFCAEVKRVTAA